MFSFVEKTPFTLTFFFVCEVGRHPGLVGRFTFLLFRADQFGWPSGFSQGRPEHHGHLRKFSEFHGRAEHGRPQHHGRPEHHGHETRPEDLLGPPRNFRNFWKSLKFPDIVIFSRFLTAGFESGGCLGDSDLWGVELGWGRPELRGV